MDVSVIIVNYNTRRMTSECIDSVFEKTRGISFEVIVVDNASTDDSREHFSQYGRITYIYNSENLGFGRANNKGIEIARGRNILFLNSDTLLINNAIKILSDYLDANPSVGACGGNLYDYKKMPMHSFKRSMPSILTETDALFAGIISRIKYGKNTDFNYTGHVLGVGYITGADLMIRHSLLNDLGGFDRRFFMYFEETELCHRIKRAGYTVMSVPDAEITHLEGASFKKKHNVINTNRMRMFRESRNLYMNITHGKAYNIAVNIIFRIGILTRIIVYAFINKSKFEYWRAEYQIIREK